MQNKPFSVDSAVIFKNLCLVSYPFSFGEISLRSTLELAAFFADKVYTLYFYQFCEHFIASMSNDLKKLPYSARKTFTQTLRLFDDKNSKTCFKNKITLAWCASRRKKLIEFQKGTCTLPQEARFVTRE